MEKSITEKKEKGRRTCMKNKLAKRFLAVALAMATAVTMMAGCAGNGKSDSGSDGKAAEFTWWIYRLDNDGQYYENYEETSVAQFISQQYWDIENGGISESGEGKQLSLSYLVPISGSENDNFNTMISTGEYPEILDLVSSSDSPEALYENGILMDITEYVEKYMPNYLAYLDANPELKPLVQVADDEGNVHYYAVYAFTDGVKDPWEGTCYRRDWIVKYAEPTKYVWDWESEYVIENGHPAVTPLEKAVEENNLEGWKKNEVTSFSADYGDDPDETYSDNVIFPSGTSDPITISDWEWMLEAFEKAIGERGWSNDSSSYGYSVQYYGYSQMGDLNSSFGGGTGTYYVKDGEVSYDGISENFKTYLECMQKWYENGWLDSQFYTRSGDIFFQINQAGVSQGKVGMWTGLVSVLGTAIRATCQNEEDARDAYVMGAALPINDMYGTKDQMYVEPDALYQPSRKGAALGITTKAEKHDEEELAALFTFLDWTYTLEGAKVIRIGLNEEQYKSVTLNPDMFAEYHIETTYTEETDEDGNIVVVTMDFKDNNTLGVALSGQRMDVGLVLTSNGDYATVITEVPAVMADAYEQWAKFLNTGNVLDYTSLLSTEESEQYNKINAAGLDYQAQNLPNVIKGTMSWEEYVKGLETIDTDTAVELLQKYIELANTARR